MTSHSRPPPTAPGSYPVVGHTLSFLRAPFSCLEAWAESGDLVTAQIAGRPFCLVSDPELIRPILANDRGVYGKAELVRDRLGSLQGESLVLLEGTDWRDRRQLLQPAATTDRIASAASLTTRYTTERVAAWPTDRSFRVDESMRELSLSILGAVLFDLELRGERTPIFEAAEAILGRMDLQSVSTYLPEWVPTPTNRRYRAAVRTLHEEIEDRIHSRVAADRGGDDLLSILLAAGLPPETIRDELIAFLFASYDSTATALSCALGLLGSHPETQAKLRAELESVLDGQPPTPADLPALPLLDAVVRESLRLYPTQYLLFREPTTAVTLGDYRLEAGTTLVLPPWVVHRDERFWDEPGAFKPERWLEADDGSGDGDGDGDGDTPADSRPAYAYFPYGGGRRHCLGFRLAEQTLRLVLAVVCTRRQLTLDGSLSIAPGPTLSLDPLELRASRIDRT